MLSLFAAIAAALAAAAPGPVDVASRDGTTRYVALPAGPDTVVAAVATRGGVVARSAVLRGRLAVPVVAADGTVDGLSFDGRTLVLAQPAYGAQLRARSRFAVINTRSFAHRTLALQGHLAFDALSPDGRRLYLIERLSARDARLYRVRTYDLVRGRLLERVVADKRTLQTAMRGLPVARTTSRDGRWAYTLYAGGAHPFVHALDTSRSEAVCLDVHGLRAASLWSVRLAVARDGSRLLLRERGRTLAVLRTP